MAHWFSLDLGVATPGERVATTLHLDPVSGTVLATNPAGERLPVEQLWCGIDGRSWRTRAPVALPKRIGTAPHDVSLTCAAEGERLACR